MASRIILITHPSVEKQNQLERLLSANNFSVIVSSTTKEGFDLARQKKPHLILSAHQSEHIDGIDFCFMIRNHPRLFTTPFMLYVNYIPWNERLNAYHIGVNDIVPESVRDEELIERISALLSFYERLSQSALKGNQALMGKLEDFKLVEIIQMLNINQKTGILTIYHDISDGQIAFNKGEITFALVQTFTGEDAIAEMVSWRRGIFIFENDIMETEQNIQKTTMQLLLDVTQKIDEATAHDDK